MRSEIRSAQRLVFFVPHGEFDAHSVQPFVEDMRNRRRLPVATLSREPDWSAYTHKQGLAGLGCHPSPAGYAFLAGEVARALSSRRD